MHLHSYPIFCLDIGFDTLQKQGCMMEEILVLKPCRVKFVYRTLEQEPIRFNSYICAGQVPEVPVVFINVKGNY